MSQMAHYQTTKEQCQCNENKIFSAIFKQDIPCCHRVLLGANFPSTPKIQPKIHQQWDKLEVKYNFIQNENEVIQEDPNDKQYIVDQIKRFSKYKKVDDIKNYVDRNFSINDNKFIDQKPVSTIQLITEGVFHFSSKKKGEI